MVARADEGQGCGLSGALVVPRSNWCTSTGQTVGWDWQHLTSHASEINEHQLSHFNPCADSQLSPAGQLTRAYTPRPPPPATSAQRIESPPNPTTSLPSSSRPQTSTPLSCQVLSQHKRAEAAALLTRQLPPRPSSLIPHNPTQLPNPPPHTHQLSNPPPALTVTACSRMSSPSTLPAPSLLSRLSPAAPLNPATSPCPSTSPTTAHDGPHPSRRVRGTRGHGKQLALEKEAAAAQPGSGVLSCSPGDVPTAPLAMRQQAAAGHGGGVTGPASPPVARSPASPRKPAPMHLQPLPSPAKAAKADIYTSRWATAEPAKVPAPAAASPSAKPSAQPTVGHLSNMMAKLNTNPTLVPPAASLANGTPVAPLKPAAALAIASPPARAPVPAAEPVKLSAAPVNPTSSPSKAILGGRSRWALETDEVPDVPESMRAVANGVSSQVPPPVAQPKPSPPMSVPAAAPALALASSPAFTPVEKAPAPTAPPAAVPVAASPPPEVASTAPSTLPSAASAALDPPPTPSHSINPDHIDWAEDDDDALPTLDDWGISTDAPLEVPAEAHAPAPAPGRPPPNAWATSAPSTGPPSKSPRLGGPSPSSAPPLSSSTRGRGRGAGRGGLGSNRAMNVAINSALAHNGRLGPNINPPLPGAAKKAARGGKHASAGPSSAPHGAAHVPALAKAPPPHLAGSAGADGGGAAASRGGKGPPPPGVFGRLSGLGPMPARGRGGGGLGRGAGSGAVERGW